MNEQIQANRSSYSFLPMEVEGLDSLVELALDLHWSWNHASDEMWRQLDPVLWELTQNPWVVLQTVSRDRLERVLADSAFRQNVDDLLRGKREAEQKPAWFQQHHPQTLLKCVAYLPAAAAYRERVTDRGALAKRIVSWHKALELDWAMLRFGEMKVETRGDHHFFEVQVYPNNLDPQAVQVELYADAMAKSSPVREEMTRVRELTGAPRGYVYSAAVPVARSTADYTARVIPHFDGVAIPLEEAQILWQR